MLVGAPYKAVSKNTSAVTNVVDVRKVEYEKYIDIKRYFGIGKLLAYGKLADFY